MPLYDFKCQDCKIIFEELVYNLSKNKTICCPKCGSKSITKLLSLFGITGTGTKTTSSCQSCSSKNCSSCK